MAANLAEAREIQACARSATTRTEEGFRLPYHHIDNVQFTEAYSSGEMKTQQDFQVRGRHLNHFNPSSRSPKNEECLQ